MTARYDPFVSKRTKLSWDWWESPDVTRHPRIRQILDVRGCHNERGNPRNRGGIDLNRSQRKIKIYGTLRKTSLPLPNNAPLCWAKYLAIRHVETKESKRNGESIGERDSRWMLSRIVGKGVLERSRFVNHFSKLPIASSSRRERRTQNCPRRCQQRWSGP